MAPKKKPNRKFIVDLDLGEEKWLKDIEVTSTTHSGAVKKTAEKLGLDWSTLDKKKWKKAAIPRVKKRKPGSGRRPKSAMDVFNPDYAGEF